MASFAESIEVLYIRLNSILRVVILRVAILRVAILRVFFMFAAVVALLEIHCHAAL